MNTKQEFMRLMNTQTEIALATSVDGQPNVRIVNFYFDEAAGTIVFSSFGDNDKVKEFAVNSKVAFSTIPHGGTEHVRAIGTVRMSGRTIYDVAEQFIAKIPDYKDTVEQAGEYLVLYEIGFESAAVILDLEQVERYHLV